MFLNSAILTSRKTPVFCFVTSDKLRGTVLRSAVVTVPQTWFSPRGARALPPGRLRDGAGRTADHAAEPSRSTRPARQRQLSAPRHTERGLRFQHQSSRDPSATAPSRFGCCWEKTPLTDVRSLPQCRIQRQRGPAVAALSPFSVCFFPGAGKEGRAAPPALHPSLAAQAGRRFH